MKRQLEYQIAWQGLKEGEHVYDYELGQDFMVEHGAPEEYSNWQATVRLRFDKHPDFFICRFEVGGSVVVPCDRCGDVFTLPLWDEFQLVLKLVENPEEEQAEDDADIEFISRHETVLDISPWLYEFAMLSVPVQKIHPDLGDGTSACNPEALKFLSTTDAVEEPENEEAPKAIWKGLEQLKNQQDKQNSN